MFLKNCWYVASWSHELPVGEPFGIVITDEPVVIYRKADKTLVALEDRCSHRLAPLSHGRCEGDNLRCMYHGLVFGPGGDCVEIPGQSRVTEKLKVRNYPVAERDGWIWVWMGDPALADVSLIPVAIDAASPDWHFGFGHLDYDASHELISDNLTDFSHLSFVHAESFNAGLNWALSLPHITELERGIRVERWVANDPVPPFLSNDLDSVDQYITYDYLAPGVLLLKTEIHPGGTSEDYPLNGPRPEPLFATFSAQAVTAKDERHTRYFFNWGPRAKDGDKSTADKMLQVALMAFDEDKQIINAQQKIIDRDPSRKPLPLKFDQGVMLFQRVMKRLITEQESARAARSAAE